MDSQIEPTKAAVSTAFYWLIPTTSLTCFFFHITLELLVLLLTKVTTMERAVLVVVETSVGREVYSYSSGIEIINLHRRSSATLLDKHDRWDKHEET